MNLGSENFFVVKNLNSLHLEFASPNFQNSRYSFFSVFKFLNRFKIKIAEIIAKTRFEAVGDEV